MIESGASRFSIDHLWQIFGEINQAAKNGFLAGMTRSQFINMAIMSRLAMVKDVGYHGYNHIKLTHCTKTIVIGYDNKIYTTDGILIANKLDDIF